MITCIVAQSRAMRLGDLEAWGIGELGARFQGIIHAWSQGVMSLKMCAKVEFYNHNRSFERVSPSQWP